MVGGLPAPATGEGEGEGRGRRTKRRRRGGWNLFVVLGVGIAEEQVELGVVGVHLPLEVGQEAKGLIDLIVAQAVVREPELVGGAVGLQGSTICACACECYCEHEADTCAIPAVAVQRTKEQGRVGRVYRKGLVRLGFLLRRLRADGAPALTECRSRRRVSGGAPPHPHPHPELAPARLHEQRACRRHPPSNQNGIDVEQQQQQQ